MSILDRFNRESDQEVIKKLPGILLEYEELLIQSKEEINLKGKNIEQANRENASYYLFYKDKAVELKILVDWMTARELAVRGSLFRHCKSTNQLNLGEREINKFIDCDKKYLAVHESLLYVTEIYEKFQAVVSAFEMRSYRLNNITKARVVAVHESEIW